MKIYSILTQQTVAINFAAQDLNGIKYRKFVQPLSNQDFLQINTEFSRIWI